jgi:hypothetical protein
VKGPAALAAALALSGAPAAAREASVTLVVHVVLDVPQALEPRPDSYCFGERRPFRSTSIPAATLARYDAALATLGTVQDRFGFGSWGAGATGSGGVAFEPVDHIFVRARAEDVAGVLRPLLGRIRRELHQQEALAEIFAARPALGQARTRIDVVVPYARSRLATLLRVHEIFDDGRRGGASQYAAPDGIHVDSSPRPGREARIEGELRAAGIAFAASAARFIPVDAPRCGYRPADR